jgi:hypothetical protein
MPKERTVDKEQGKVYHGLRCSFDCIPRRRQTMRADVRERLVAAAKSGETVTYGELMKQFGIPRGSPNREKGIGDVVGQISMYEHSKGRPPISAIVVTAGSRTLTYPQGLPSGGFFGLPGIPPHLKRQDQELGNPLTLEDKEYARQQQKRVWAYWKVHDYEDSG